MKTLNILETINIDPIIVLQDQNAFEDGNALPFLHFSSQIWNMPACIAISEIDHINGTEQFIFEGEIFTMLFNKCSRLMQAVEIERRDIRRKIKN